MICNNCKKELPDGSVFCNFCGTKLEAVDEKQEVTEITESKSAAEESIEKEVDSIESKESDEKNDSDDMAGSENLETDGFISEKKDSFFEKNKKIVVIGAIILAVVIVIAIIIANGPSAEAKSVKGLISDIGTVTIESNADISAAESAFEALSDEDKKHVSNADDLTKARDKYNALIVEQMIDDIGKVSDSSGDKISAAREKYDELSDSAKEYVSNYDTLTKSEDTYYTALASKVDELIGNIGDVTAESGDKIREARDEYDKLNDTGKKKVTKAKDLEKAEKSYGDLRKDELIGKMEIEEDKVQNCKFYSHKTTPTYADTRSYFLPYIGMDDTSVWMNAEIDYTGDDWVFWEKLTFLVDGETYTKTFNYHSIDRQTSWGDVFEYYNGAVTKDDYEIIKKIPNSKETIIRFEGDHQRYDLTVSAADKAAIKDICDLYEILTH